MMNTFVFATLFMISYTFGHSDPDDAQSPESDSNIAYYCIKNEFSDKYLSRYSPQLYHRCGNGERWQLEYCDTHHEYFCLKNLHRNKYLKDVHVDEGWEEFHYLLWVDECDHDAEWKIVDDGKKNCGVKIQSIEGDDLWNTGLDYEACRHDRNANRWDLIAMYYGDDEI